MNKLLPSFVMLAFLVSAGAPSAADDLDPRALDDDERLLESAGLPCEGPGLLEFFRGRACTKTEAGQIEDLVRRFSGSSFENRIHAGAELVALGPLAIPGLRRAVNDLEAPEMRERARHCLALVEGQASAALVMAAARVLAQRKPAGAAEALLAYLPFADNDEVTREITAAPQKVASADGRVDPVLVRALSDPMPLRRAVAGAVLSQTAPGERQAVEKLLQDPNPEVRMGAAVALAKANNVAAIPVLIDLMAILPAAKRTQVEEVLQDLAGESAPVGGPSGEDEIARRIRRDAWAGWWANTEGPALAAMLHKRTLSPAELERVTEAIRRLGDKAYAAREKAVVELIARGRMVLPLLREALKSDDLEVVRRSQRCIQRIEDEPANRLPAAALRLLALRKPAGAIDTLLAYLPFAEEETVSDVYAAMALLAVRDGKPDPALLAALTSTRPTVRAAAAEALAANGGADARPAIRKLLDDGDLTVRMRVAQALAPRDAQAVQILISLIADLQAEQAWQVHDFLIPLAGEQAPPAPEDNAAGRKKSSAAWAAWWKENAAKTDLAKLASTQHQVLGYTVICEINTGKILELGRDRKPRWSFAGTQSPVDAWVLPNNRVVVAEHSANKVTERDLKGKILWQKQLNGNPHNVQRLPNGHTLIATNMQVVEVDRNGKEVFSLNNLNQIFNNFGQLTGGYKTRKGHYVCVTQNGRCVTLDATGKELKSFNTNRGNAWFDVLPNGRIVMAQNGGNKVAEYDPDGKLLVEIDVPQVSIASGMPNGHFVTASNQTGRVAEFDRKGKVVWEYTAQGPFRARMR